ncbi:hypothetical protein BDF21DRAFT_439139 [Thamnidium elegans]|nr:hypothetical protein BDF21DRAFT_439139 [Thamnidium elegans]
MTDELAIEIDSIEQQIEIYILDLFESKETRQTLEGLRYLMDSCIKGGQYQKFNENLMHRLMKGLMLFTGKTEGHVLRKKSTLEANMAFFLFIDFLQQVEEFRGVINQLPVFELRDRLKIHLRCQSYSTETQRKGAITMIQLLLAYFPQCQEWQELIKAEEVNRVMMKSTLALSNTSSLLPPQALYFDQTIDKLKIMYPNSKTDAGLSTDLVQPLHDHYGYNKLPDPPKPSPFKIVWAQLSNFMVLILIAATVVEAAEKDFNSMSVLLAVIVLNTMIGFTQQWKASKTLNALMNLTVPKAQVLRDGKPSMVDSSDLVPGDIVVLEEGDAVPADLRLIEVSQLQVIESILTGESLPVQKSTDMIQSKTRHIPIGDCKGNAFMSTSVVRGRAKGVVVRIGKDTEIGKISTAIQQTSNSKTPIQIKLDRLGKYLVFLSFILCILVVGIGILWKKDVHDMINVGLSLAVSVIPEGLVAVTTVTMALGVRRMAANQCIVRTLPAVESLGSVTVVCSDKTGTLTEGKMGMSELWTAGDDTLYQFTESTSLDPEQGTILMHARKANSVTQTEEEETKEKLESIMNDSESTLMTPYDDKTTVVQTEESYSCQLRYALMVSSLCNNSSVYRPEAKEWKALGDPTEIALTVAAEKGKLGRSYWQEQGFKKLYENAFDSERKLMSCVYGNEQENILLCKGAPEEVIKRCRFYWQEKELDEIVVNRVLQKSARMADGGLRVLALAYKKYSSGSSLDEYAEAGLTFIGLVGIIDPCKTGVKEAISTCQAAGIRVIMITGDHVKTATAIATQLGIFNPDHADKNLVILGQELDLLSQEAIVSLTSFPCVFARVSPDNKLKIVQALQKRGELVAMTGDGVNDAPAIKCADVGVAMGLAGTEITKQAADLVLLDDDFSTIVNAVEEGRHVFDNILKFIVYLLSCNGAEIFLMLICAIVNLDTPLTVMMILYANIIADIPPAIALGMEPKEVGLMKRHPRNPKQDVLSKVTWSIILFQSLMIALLTIGAFATITTLQLLHSFLSRSILQSVFVSGIFGNWWMIYAFLVSFSCLLAGIYTPGVSSWLELSFVDGTSWIMILCCCVVQVGLVEIQKWVVRRFNGKI